MMRKTSVILLSAATGAALTLFVTQPRSMLMGSSARAATMTSSNEIAVARGFSVATAKKDCSQPAQVTCIRRVSS